MHPYLNVPTPHVLAHQGLALGIEANSIPAFSAALAAGAAAVTFNFDHAIQSAFMLVSTISGCIGIYQVLFKKKDAK